MFLIEEPVLSPTQYDPDARMIVVDVKKPKGDRQNDLSNMAYYMEKDVREFLFFLSSNID